MLWCIIDFGVIIHKLIIPQQAHNRLCFRLCACLFFGVFFHSPADDLRLILNTQQDLYSPDELKLIEEQLENRINQDKKDEEEFIKKHLPDEIPCPKCDGVNPFENEKCCYCGHTFDKSKYYNINYYRQEESETAAEEETDKHSYTFQYVISFLIPLVGFILGAILLSKDDEEEKSAGKTVIILGIVSIVIGTLITVFFLK